MKRRKGSLLQRMMAVLLCAVLVICMASNAAPVSVLAADIASGKDVDNADSDAADAEINVEKIDLPANFIEGVDISSYDSLKNSGVKFYDFDGNELDYGGFFTLLKDSGVNYVRLRVWNDPFDADGNGYGGGNNSIKNVKKMGKAASEAGLKVLIDFHYSDFWADPGKQNVPKAWQGYTVYQKERVIQTYTRDSLKELLENGVDVCMVQIGNETNNSFCGESGWESRAKLLNAGSVAVRNLASERGKDILVALHFTNPERKGGYAAIAKQLDDYKVDYDVFASSYYPYWHGTLDNLKSVLSDIATTYGKKVMVAETSWATTLEDGDGHDNTIRSSSYGIDAYDVSVQGQADEVTAVIRTIADTTNGIGVFYWEPAWIPVQVYHPDAENAETVLAQNRQLWEEHGSGWASSYAREYDAEDAGKWFGGSMVDNQAMFDFEGHPLDSLNVWKYVKTGAVATINKQNLLKDRNYSFEDGLDGWTITPPASGVVGVDKRIPRTGSFALGYQYSGKSETFTVTQTVTLDAGEYSFGAYMQGQFTGDNERLEMIAQAGGEKYSAAAVPQEWKVWQNPEINNIRVTEDGTEVTIGIKGKVVLGTYGGSEGTWDDFYLYKDKHAVTFVDGGAKEVVFVADGGSAVAPDFTKDGYRLDGWDKEFDFVTSNMTVTAQWELIPYGIRYELNGGTNAPENPDRYTVETETVTLADASRTGYTFAGWYSDEELTQQVTEITKGTTGDITLYAKWTEEEPPHAHTLVKHDAVPATCTEAGTGAYWKCEGSDGCCGLMFADAEGETELEQIPAGGNATGHSYGNPESNGDGTHTRTCQNDSAHKETERCSGGTPTYTKRAVCSVCGGSYGEVLSDTTPPDGKIKIADQSWEGFLNTVTFGLFFKETKRVVIEAEDTGSGVDQIYYYISDSARSKEEIKALGADAWTKGVSVSVNPDRKCVIYAKITDKAGNVAYLSSDGMVFDGTAPAITGVTDGETYTAPREVTVSDANLEGVTVNGTPVILTDSKFTLGTADGPQTIVATDKAGNTTAVTVTVKAETHTHDYGKWQHDDAQHWKKCACGEEKDRANHEFGDWITDREATADEAGTKHRECKTCAYKETEAIPATGDAPGTGTVAPEVKPGENAPATIISTSAAKLEDLLLTPEEKKQVQNGTDIRIVLEVKDATNTVSDSDKKSIREALSGFGVGQYLNIDLYKLIGETRKDISETDEKIKIVINVPDDLKNTDTGKTRTYAAVRVHDGKAELLPDLDDSPGIITIETDRFSTYAIVYKDTSNGNGGSQGGDNNGNSGSAGQGSSDNKVNAGNNQNNDGAKTDKDNKDHKNDDDGDEDKTKEKDNKDNDSSRDKGKNDGGKGDPDKKDDEPKTGDTAPIEVYATLAMIAGFTWLLLYFTDRKKGMTEETKKELVSRIIGWAKRGGRIRKYFALAAIFVLLVYYHCTKKLCNGAGRNASEDWKKIYEE